MFILFIYIMRHYERNILHRYKIVCLVTIGQRKYQKVMVASRCLWNGSHDTCTSASYANLSLFATAMVFGVYFE